MTDRPVRDVIIVGAGMAGLAAAHALRAFDVQVLECDSRPGGRVKTVAARGGTLDLGACLAFDARLLPDGAAPPSLQLKERGPLGIQLGPHRAFAGSAWGAVEGLGLPESVRQALAGLREGRLSIDELPEPAAAVARALFQQIHPGDLAAYTRSRQGDAWRDWYPDHWVGGNGRLVEAYRDQLRAELLLGASVTRLAPGPGAVLVDYTLDGGQHEQASARAVVVATPAMVARKLMTPDDPETAAFLGRVRYGRYTVVAFALEAPIGPFRVVVTPGAAFALAMQQRGPATDFAALICYYDDARCDVADTRDDAQLAEATARELARLGLTNVDVRATPWWVERWPVSGTILDEAYAAGKRPGLTRASRRVFLAGDYLVTTPGWGYGLDDAVTSGRAAGALVAEFLANERETDDARDPCPNADGSERLRP